MTADPTAADVTGSDAQPKPQPRPPLAADGRGEAGACPAPRAPTRGDPTLNPGPQPLVITVGDGGGGRWQRLRRWAHPPNVRSELPPTREQIAWHGSWGEHVSREGWPRSLAYGWAHGLARPVRVAVLWLDWVARSPSRSAAAAALYALLAHLPGLSWLPWPPWP